MAEKRGDNENPDVNEIYLCRWRVHRNLYRAFHKEDWRFEAMSYNESYDSRVKTTDISEIKALEVQGQ